MCERFPLSERIAPDQAGREDNAGNLFSGQQIEYHFECRCTKSTRICPDRSQRRCHLGGKGSVVVAEYINVSAWYHAALLHFCIKRDGSIIVDAENSLDIGILVQKPAGCVHGKASQIPFCVIALFKGKMVLFQNIEKNLFSLSGIRVFQRSADHAKAAAAHGVDQMFHRLTDSEVVVVIDARVWFVFGSDQDTGQPLIFGKKTANTFFCGIAADRVSRDDHSIQIFRGRIFEQSSILIFIHDFRIAGEVTVNIFPWKYNKVHIRCLCRLHDAAAEGYSKIFGQSAYQKSNGRAFFQWFHIQPPGITYLRLISTFYYR